jgi:hypothetical protein
MGQFVGGDGGGLIFAGVSLPGCGSSGVRRRWCEDQNGRDLLCG